MKCRFCAIATSMINQLDGKMWPSWCMSAMRRSVVLFKTSRLSGGGSISVITTTSMATIVALSTEMMPVHSIDDTFHHLVMMPNKWWARIWLTLYLHPNFFIKHDSCAWRSTTSGQLDKIHVGAGVHSTALWLRSTWADFCNIYGRLFLLWMSTIK